MKSSVFRSRRNEDGRWQLRSGTGSEFDADGPATAKLRGPYRTVFATGTARSPRAAERRWRRPVLSATGWHMVDRKQVPNNCWRGEAEWVTAENSPGSCIVKRTIVAGAEMNWSTYIYDTQVPIFAMYTGLQHCEMSNVSQKVIP